MKKKNGTYRMCVDLRKVNTNLRKLAFNMPLLDEILEALKGAKIFSLMDIKDAYLTIPIEESSKHLLAFEILTKGKYEYEVLPFGLANWAPVFLKTINTIMGDILFDGCVAFSDDILIFSKTVEEHCRTLKKVLERLRKYDLRVAANKMVLAADQVTYLGLVLTSEGANPCPAKTAAIDAMEQPNNLRQLQGVMGSFNFYKRFIQNYSKICAPLYNLLRKDVEFIWDSACQEAYDHLKKALTSDPILIVGDVHEIRPHE